MTVLTLLIAQKVVSLAVCPQTGLVAAGFADGYIRLYDGSTGANTGVRLCHQGPVNSLEFFGDSLLSAGPDGIKVWSVDTMGPGRAFGQEAGVAVLFAGLALDSKMVVSVDQSHPIRLWDLRKRKLKKQKTYSGTDVNLVASCAATDGKLLFVGYDGWESWVWDVKKMDTVKVFPVWSPVKHPDCAFSRDGKMLAFCEDDAIFLFSVPGWKQKRVIQVPDTATALCFSDDNALVFATTKGKIKVWKDGQSVWEYHLDKGRVNALAFGNGFVYAGCDKGLALIPFLLNE